MATAKTAVSYCNQALNLIGSPVIASFQEGSEKALTCSLQYDRIVDMLLSMAVWQFARKKRQLSRLTGTPANEYNYQYQLPSDLLDGPHGVYNSAVVGARPMQGGWAIFEDRLFTNEQTILIDYSFRPNESKFPNWFVGLLVLALAGSFAKAITDQDDLAREYNQRAFGPPSDNMRGGTFLVCTQINRRQGGAQILPTDEFVAARHSL